MKFRLKVYLLTVLSLMFLFCSAAENNGAPGHFIESEIFPEEIQEKIPEDIDFSGYVHAQDLPIFLLRKKIKRKLNEFYYLQNIRVGYISNQYYIFGSSKQDYCVFLVRSTDGNAKNIYHSITAQLKKKAKDVKESKNSVVSEKEQLLFYLYSDDLLLVSVGKTDLKKFTAAKMAPILPQVKSGYLISLYYKGDLKRIPLLQDYTHLIPSVSGFKEAYLSFSRVSFCLNAEVIFNSQKDAEQVFKKLESTIKIIEKKFPEITSEFSYEIDDNKIELSFSIGFFTLIKNIVKDPEIQKEFKKKIL